VKANGASHVAGLPYRVDHYEHVLSSVLDVKSSDRLAEVFQQTLARLYISAVINQPKESFAGTLKLLYHAGICW
jgi:hypothetical protein